MRLGTQSQRRSNQGSAAPSCCGVAPLCLYGDCYYITPTTLGAVGAPLLELLGRPNGETPQHDGAARRNIQCVRTRSVD